jgi:hypothetical protein
MKPRMTALTCTLLVRTFASLEAGAKEVTEALGWVNYFLATWISLDHSSSVGRKRAVKLPPASN